MGEQALKAAEAIDDPLGRFAFAYFLQNLNRWDEALAAYEAFAEQWPMAVEAPFNMALCLIAKLSAVPPGVPKNIRDAETARDLLLLARTLGLGAPLLNFVLGRVHLILDEGEKAEKLFEALTTNDDTNPMFWQALGEARERQKNIKGALYAYRRCAELTPDHGIRRHWLNLARKTGETEGLDQVILFITEEPPTSREGQILKAEALALLGQTEDMGDLPTTAEYWSAKALAYAKRGQEEQAADALRRALNMDYQANNTDFARHGDLSPLTEICRRQAALREKEGTAFAVCALKLNPRGSTDILTVLLGQEEIASPFATARTGRTTEKISVHTILWGERYVEQFLRHSLPSLLSPNNIPALCDGLDAEYVIDTQPQDQEAMERSDAIRALASHAKVRFTHIAEAKKGGSRSYDTIGDSWRRFIDEAKKEDKGMLFHVPDVIVGDGGLATVRTHMEQGTRAVVSSSLTAIDIPFLAALEKEFKPISSRRLADLAFEHLHPLVGWLSHGADNWTNWPYVTYWREKRAALARGYMLHPIYVHPADWSAGFTDTVDWDYAVGAIPDPGLITVIRDSDDLMMVEFSDINKREPKPGEGYANPFDMALWAKRKMPPATWPFFGEKMFLHGEAPREEIAALEESSDLFAKAVAFVLNGGLEP